MTTYAELENSVCSGSPVELYRFAHGTNVWTYNTGEVDITHEGEIYTPLALGRDGEMVNSGEPNKTNITVPVPIGFEVSKLYLSGSPEQVVLLTVFRHHYGANGPVVYWKGRVASVSWDEGKASLFCESIFTSLKRTGLRARYQRGCRHALYGPGCRVDKAAHALPGLVAAIDASNTVITIAAAGSLPDDHFTAGMVQFIGGLRFILKHDGTNITISSPIPGIAGGEEAILYPGCNHTRIACSEKFDNILNYGGFPWIPTKNPFHGSLV